MPGATILFHRLAGEEFDRARRWYAAERAGLDDEFAAEIDHAVERIAANPLSGSVFRRRFRWIRLRRFPYLLYYVILQPDQVLVLAVAHSRRRPGYWISRLYRP